MRVWIIREGMFYDDKTWIAEVCRTKQIAVNLTRAHGFTWNSGDGFFSNDKDRLYRKIVSFEVVMQ